MTEWHAVNLIESLNELLCRLPLIMTESEKKTFESQTQPQNNNTTESSVHNSISERKCHDISSLPYRKKSTMSLPSCDSHLAKSNSQKR